jgi:hypothetical protein
MKKPRKPTGITGSLRLESGKEPAFQQVEFPKSKAEVERHIAESFAATPADLGFKIIRISSNSENDLDFQLETDGGRVYLELMEIAPLELTKGSYEEASNEYLIYEFVEAVRDKIVAKSKKYSSTKQPRIILLVYITHWAFNLGVQALCLLQYMLCHSDLCFEKIFLHTPSSPEGMTELLYPSPKEFWRAQGFDPEAYRGLRAFAIDLRSAKLHQG